MSAPDHSIGLSSHGTSCCLGNSPGELEGPPAHGSAKTDITCSPRTGSPEAPSPSSDSTSQSSWGSAWKGC